MCGRESFRPTYFYPFVAAAVDVIFNFFHSPKSPRSQEYLFYYFSRRQTHTCAHVSRIFLLRRSRWAHNRFIRRVGTKDACEDKRGKNNTNANKLRYLRPTWMSAGTDGNEFPERHVERPCRYNTMKRFYDAHRREKPLSDGSHSGRYASLCNSVLYGNVSMSVKGGKKSSGDNRR